MLPENHLYSFSKPGKGEHISVRPNSSPFPPPPLPPNASFIFNCFHLQLAFHDLYNVFCFVNPLTPVPPVTARDEAWPFFLFWRHCFWPNLASPILNFCRRRRSFQWCPDQSDRPNGALDMDQNAQKVEWKTWSKISCHYTWMLHARNYPSRWRFLRSFLTTSKPSRRSITAAKTREKEKKEGRKKKISKNRKV